MFRLVLTSVCDPAAVEPVDSWRPDANIYESGEGLRSPALVRIGSKHTSGPRKSSWNRVQPVIHYGLEQMLLLRAATTELLLKSAFPEF